MRDWFCLMQKVPVIAPLERASMHRILVNICGKLQSLVSHSYETERVNYPLAVSG